jgi:hypothetical protein
MMQLISQIGALRDISMLAPHPGDYPLKSGGFNSVMLPTDHHPASATRSPCT